MPRLRDQRDVPNLLGQQQLGCHLSVFAGVAGIRLKPLKFQAMVLPEDLAGHVSLVGALALLTPALSA